MVKGERYLLTLICVASRYPYLRALATRDSETIAMNLLDIILDCGVVPAIVQSDNEFVSLALEELVALMGSTQIFSTAFRPQSQGIVERSHRVIREALSVLIAAYVRAVPNKWPTLLRWVETKLRHKPILIGDKHITPYAVIHGFFGSSSLETALGRFQEIPSDLVLHDWLAEIVAESQKLTTALVSHFAIEAHKNAQRLASEHPRPNFKVGELVLAVKPFYEKGQGLLLPQADGPYLINSMPDDHTVTLVNPVTFEPFQHGKRISTARIIRFHFPAEHLEADQKELEESIARPFEVKVDDLIAVELHKKDSNIFVARVKRVFEVGSQLECRVFEVAAGQRYGPWERRPWTPTETD